MGMAPDSVRRMSLFQFGAAVDGWNKANGGEGQKSLSERDIDEIGSWLSEPPVWVQ